MTNTEPNTDRNDNDPSEAPPTSPPSIEPAAGTSILLSNTIDPDDSDKADYTNLRNAAFGTYALALLHKHGFEFVEQNRTVIGAHNNMANYHTGVGAIYHAHYESLKTVFWTGIENAHELDDIRDDFLRGDLFTSDEHNEDGCVGAEFFANYDLPWTEIQNVILSNLQGWERAQLIWDLKNWHLGEKAPKPWWNQIQPDPNRRRPQTPLDTVQIKCA